MTDLNIIYWVMGYDSFWDGYDLTCMADQTEPKFNEQFMRGWLEAKNEDIEKFAKTDPERNSKTGKLND